MMIAAGIDIGNSTTEVVLARIDDEGVDPLYVSRAKTVGEKGSPQSLQAAVRVLERAERLSGFACEAIAVAELHPVRTLVAEFPETPARDGPLRAVSGGWASTPAGCGLVHGTNVPIDGLSGAPIPDDVLVSVPRGVDFEDVARAIGTALAQGWRIVGTILAADEAVLVGNRLPISMPIVDEVDVEKLKWGCTIALEVAEPGEAVKSLSDPVCLAAIFGLPSSVVEELAPLARSLSDSRIAVVTTRSAAGLEDPRPDGGWLEISEGGCDAKVSLASVHRSTLSRLPPGSVTRLQPPPNTDLAEAIKGCEDLVRDIFISDLPALRERSSVRRGSARLDAAPMSVYLEPSTRTDPEVLIGGATQRPVWVASDESHAARLGALTTPAAPSDATVCDLGGGTIDVVGEAGAVVAAGAGELLTISVAFALGLSRGLAEYVKRAPSVRVEAPHVVRHEDGSRAFLDDPAVGAAVGRLCIRRGHTYIPFTDALSPEEWRALRLSIKANVIAGNIERCLHSLHAPPRVLLLCGGAAEDKELVRIVGDWVGAKGTAAGRTNVAGRFGPRYAVALGLVVMLARRHDMNSAIVER